jgi:hypothetical protein
MGQVRKYRRSGPLAIHGGAVMDLHQLREALEQHQPVEPSVRLGLTDRLQ